MKRELNGMYLSLIVILFVLVSTQSVVAENCRYSLDIYIDVEAMNENGEVAEYQFPDFKENTYFYIKRMIVLNDGNCTVSQGGKLKPILKNAEGGEEYLTHFVTLPEIRPNNSYVLTYVGGNPPNEYERSIMTSNLKNGMRIYDYNNRTLLDGITRISKKSLDMIGKWSINAEVDLSQLHDSYGSSVYIENSNQKDFNVHSRFEIKSLETAKKQEHLVLWGNMIGFLALMATIVGALGTVWYKDKLDRKRKHLEDLKINIKNWLAELDSIPDLKYNIGFLHKVNFKNDKFFKCMKGHSNFKEAIEKLETSMDKLKKYNKNCSSFAKELEDVFLNKTKLKPLKTFDGKTRGISIKKLVNRVYTDLIKKYSNGARLVDFAIKKSDYILSRKGDMLFYSGGTAFALGTKKQIALCKTTYLDLLKSENAKKSVESLIEESRELTEDFEDTYSGLEKLSGVHKLKGKCEYI